MVATSDSRPRTAPLMTQNLKASEGGDLKPVIQSIQWQAATQCSGFTSRQTGSSWAQASVA